MKKREKKTEMRTGTEENEKARDRGMTMRKKRGSREGRVSEDSRKESKVVEAEEKERKNQ